MRGLILLTGGCGFIGSHIYEALSNREEQVVVLDDLSTGKVENLPTDAMLFEGSVCDQALLENIFSRFEIKAVIHQAARINTSVRTEVPAIDVDVSVLGTLNLLQLCVDYSVPQFVFASSVAVYGRALSLPVTEGAPLRPIYSYGIAKLTAEKYVEWYSENHGLKCQILRYSNIYGPRQSIRGEVGVIAIFTNNILNGEELVVFGDGSHLRDYLYVDDAVRGTLVALESKHNGVFNLASGVGTSTIEVVSEFKNYCRSRKVLFRPERDGELGRFYCDTTKIQGKLGWKARVPLCEGIHRTIRHYTA
jgi:UDP-glucose 4-epimerase